MRPEWRDIIKKLPKRRGYGKNRARTVFGDRPRPVIIQLERLDALYGAGEEVSPKSLIAHKLLRIRGNSMPKVKIVGGGSLTKKLVIQGCLVTSSVRAAVEKAGGTIA
jgi:ribosomal protein L15